MLLSIIIPTLNEEKYLPQLLESIKRQSFKDYEIIVADAGSKDRTIEITKNYGCKVVQGGLPAKGRNAGAKVARGETFLFVDADVILEDNFLKNSLEEFKRYDLGLASFLLNPQTDAIFMKLIFWLYRWFLLATEKLMPFGGVVILAKREVYDKLAGFDEQITLGEDTDFLRRGARLAKYRLLRKSKIGFSVRRFEKLGRLRTLFKYILSGLYFIFLGFPRKDIFKYKFDIYRDKS